MKNTVKIMMLLSIVMTSFNMSAQSKADKKRAKAKAANDKFIVENKQTLLDGKHQTKMFFSTSENLESTADLCNEFTLENGKELHVNMSYEDEINNLIINKATSGGVKFKTFTPYTGGKFKINLSSSSYIREFKILKNGKEVYSTSSVSKTQNFTIDPKDKERINGLAFWLNNNFDQLKEDCSLQCVYKLTAKADKFSSDAEKAFFKENSTIFEIKSNILKWKYDELKATKYFLNILGYKLKYYDVESKDKKIVNSAFSNYIKSKRLKSENITVLKTIKKEWGRVDYSNIQKQKGRSCWVLVFYQNKQTKEVHAVRFNLYQDLIGSHFGDAEIFQAIEKFERDLVFLNLTKKEIGLYLKSHTLESAL